MSITSKRFLRIVLLVVLIGFCLPVVGSEASQIGAVEARPPNEDVTGSSCVSVRLDLTASTTMPIPDFCIDGLCKLIMYVDEYMGAFGPGYSWEVYYFQLSEFDNRWNGGPNIAFAGVEFSDGIGHNGNGIAEAVFQGGTTSDGGYVRIMDDSPAENSPSLWSIESQSSPSLTEAVLSVCDIPGEVWSGFINQNTIVPVPEFCIDQLCMILRWTDASFGSFGPGLSWPVYYIQNSSTGEWIAGPTITFGGVQFSYEGSGNNGDVFGETIFSDMSNLAEGGGYAALYDDDGLEQENHQWNVLFQSGDVLSEVFYYFAPMDCTRINITEQYTNLNVPAYCVDSLCTLVRWTDAQFSSWGPGLSWPVSYKQNSFDHTWIGGPNAGIAGAFFSDGWGLNGDTAAEEIFDGGRTENGGYVVLRDDSVTAGELDSGKWNVVLNQQDDLTAASYYICSNTCQETIFLINKQYLPLTVK